MDKSKSIIWKQFKNRKIGYYSFILIVVMFGISILAPFIANDKPVYIYSKFPSLYSYFYRSAHKNAEVLLSVAGEEKELKEKEAYYVEGFNEQRQILQGLNDSLVSVGNRYDAVIKEIYRIEGQIGEMDGMAEGKDALLAKKEELEQKRNEIGGEKNQIQAEIVKQTNIQNYKYNQPLLEIRFKLATKSIIHNLLGGLSSMKHLVDDTVIVKIDAIMESIKGMQYDNLDRSLIEKAEREISLLSPDNIGDNLDYKGIFPIFGFLSILDIFLILCYFGVVGVLITGPHNIFNIKKMGILLAVLFLLSLLLYDVFPKWPKMDYKALLKNSIEEGYAESYGIFTPIPYGLNENNFYESYQKPMFIGTDDQYSRHILGTDDNGRSIITRMIWGSRVSLSVGFVSVTLYVILGIIIGSIAGYYGKWIDIGISRFIEVMMCFPSFFLILTVIAFIGPSIYNIMIVIGLTRWTGIARLIRGEFLRIKGQDYVQAGRALGASPLRSIAMHILPNALTPVLVSAAFGFAGAVLVEAGLSFLGFGVQDPMASWGQMLSSSKGHPLLYWWMFIIPGFALFITVTLYNLVGNTLRDAIDPRLRM